MKTNNKLKKWLLKYNFDANLEEDDEFSYYYDDECIHWSNNKTDHDKYYLDFIKHLGYNKEFDIRTISFLHELGHHELSYVYDSFDYFIDNFRSLLEGNCKNKLELKIKANLYYRLPLEYKATKWMIEFTDIFYKECKELDKIFLEV